MEVAAAKTLNEILEDPSERLATDEKQELTKAIEEQTALSKRVDNIIFTSCSHGIVDPSRMSLEYLLKSKTAYLDGESACPICKKPLQGYVPCFGRQVQDLLREEAKVSIDGNIGE